MKRLRRCYWAIGSVALVLMLCGTQRAVAQEVTATITGTVTDASGAAVVGATVTAKSVDRGITYPVVTNEAGLYRISQLPIGSYELRVEKLGFQTTAYPAFTLALNQIGRIDVELKVGQVTETVEVSGSAPILKTETTQVDTIIDAVTNDNLPLASRNYVQLTLLAPGSVSTDPSSFNNGNNTAGYGGRPLINGNREQANYFLLDGMDNNQVSDNLLGYTPAPDAIEEFNLITSNAPAEFGSFMGGIVSATIKSGTNSFHGDIWEFFRNDVLNANSWSNNFNDLPKAKLRWNMFGGTLGGPILKNKLFFFVDYQGQRFDTPTSSTPETVFTSAERTGDFSALCPAGFNASGICSSTSGGNIQLYNPCVSFTAPCTASSAAATTRLPFVNNQIPLSMISPVAQALFGSSLYLSPINSSLQNNASYITNSQENVDQGDIKVDYKASDKDSISGRFTRAFQNNPSANSYELLGNGFSTTPIYNIVGDWTRSIRPNLINDGRFGWSHITLNNGTSWASGVGQFGNTIGIGNGNPAGLDGLLALNFSDDGNLNLGNAETGESFNDQVYQGEDAVTWTHGRHTFKFGGEYNHEIIKTFYPGNNGELGLMDFDGRFTSDTIGSASTGAGYGAADFFLGLPYTIGRGVSTGKTWTQTDNIVALYVEDTWKVTERLTLNLGLRYQLFTPWIEVNNQQSNYNFATGAVELAGQDGNSRSLYNGVYGGKDLEPRIGFAWTPAMLGTHTVIRGAFTISSYLEGTGTNLRLPQNPPFTPAQINTVYNSVSLPGSTTADGIPATPPTSSCLNYSCFAGAILDLWDPNVQPAIDNQWNLAVQHQFWGDTTFQIGYVGQKANHLMVPFSYTQRVLLPNSSCGTPPCTAPSTFFAENPAFYNTIATQTGGTQSNGTMMYNSLQAVLQKQAGHGLQYQVSYTYSKCMSDSTGYYGAWNNALSASAYWQNIYDAKSEWAPCYYDATHIISAYAVYELPVGRGKAFGSNMNKVANAAVGGWSVSPIVSFRTGFPMPVYGAADNSGTFSRGSRADCSGLPAITGETPISPAAFPGVGGFQWFTNNGNFTNPAVGTFGDCAPQLAGVRGPHYTDVDMSLHKDFPLTERFKLQFRTEFINAFNHVQLNAPNMSLGSNMGQVTSAQPPRNIQFALKLYY
ncbi:MAG: TonB-dependent receptor [Candidatus Acidiferrum sp.]|jgi:carboxypeptidase family protein